MAAAPASRPAAIARWLTIIAAMVFAMVVIGGITRLTESGLSMVRWEPVSGVIPPLSDAAWQAEFDAYKAYPEYQKINRGMSLAAFKAIYFWEYLHRLLGRLVGLAYALPLAWFAWRRAIPRGYGARLVGLLVLGGLQGAVGWWMVASGLVDRPDVAHERLAVHLNLALLLLGALAWTVLDMRALARGADVAVRRPWWVAPFFILLFGQFVFGAFVAGLDAGYAFNTWPMMGEWWVPPLGSLIDDPVTVQFVHRWLAVAVAVAALGVARALHRSGVKGAGHALATMVGVQFALGVATLLSGVDIVLGVLHQAGAAVLLVVAVWAAHRSSRRPDGSQDRSEAGAYGRGDPDFRQDGEESRSLT